MSFFDLLNQNTVNVAAGVAPPREQLARMLGLKDAAAAESPQATQLEEEPVDLDKLLADVGTDVISEADRQALKADPDAAKRFVAKLTMWRESAAEAKAKEAEERAAADAEAARRERARLSNLATTVFKAERAK